MIILIILLAILWGYLFYYGDERIEYFATLLSTITFFIILGVAIYIVYQAYITTTTKLGVNILVVFYVFAIFSFIEIFMREKYHFWQKEFWSDTSKDGVLRGRESKWSDIFIGIGVVIVGLSIGDSSLDITFYRLELSVSELISFLTLGIF